MSLLCRCGALSFCTPGLRLFPRSYLWVGLQPLVLTNPMAPPHPCTRTIFEVPTERTSLGGLGALGCIDSRTFRPTKKQTQAFLDRPGEAACNHLQDCTHPSLPHTNTHMCARSALALPVLCKSFTCGLIRSFSRSLPLKEFS